MSRALMFIASAAVAGCGVLIDDPAGYCRGKTENYSVAWSMVGQPANVVVEFYGKPANAKPRGGGYTELMFRKRGSIYQNSRSAEGILTVRTPKDLGRGWGERACEWSWGDLAAVAARRKRAPSDVWMSRIHQRHQPAKTGNGGNQS